MPNHIEYDPGVPTFKHSDKFESRAMVKMMQKEATLAERAWEERTSQRDNNKVYFNHLTRDEAELDLKVRMDNYEPENKNFTYSQTGEKIGTGLLASYHSDIAGKNVMMKELRRNEKLKRKTERMIARAVEKKTGNQQDIAVWPPPEFPDAEKVLSKEEPKPEPVKTPEPSEEKVEFKKRKVPAGLAKRLAAKRKAAGLPELEVAKPEPNIDVAKAEEAAKAALGEMANFSIPGMDVDKLKKLLAGEKVDEVKPKPSAPPGLKPGETAKKSGGVNYVNMPSEVPLSIPGLPAGWKFGDEMPTGFVPEPEPEKQNVALEIAQSTQRKRKRPDQPVIFQKDAMGALVDPTRFNTQIEQENLTPKQPGYYIQKRKEEQAKRDAHEAMMRQTSAKVISSGPQMSSTDQYTSNDFQRTYAAGHVRNNRMYGTYDASAIDVSKHRNKYNRYKGGGVGGGGYR